MTACDDPAHPELIGLWGVVEHGEWRARLLYDGCCVTIEERVISDETWLLQARLAGPPPNEGLSWRTQAVWQSDTLLSRSLLFDEDHPVARASDDAWLLLHGSDAPRALVRAPRTRTWEARARDMICARAVAGRVRAPERHVCGTPSATRSD